MRIKKSANAKRSNIIIIEYERYGQARNRWGFTEIYING